MDPDVKKILDEIVKGINEGKDKRTLAKQISNQAKYMEQIAEVTAELRKMQRAGKITKEAFEDLESQIKAETREREKAEKVLGDIRKTGERLKNSFIGLGDASVTGAEKISYYSGAFKDAPLVGGIIDGLGKSLDFNIDTFRVLSSVGADFGRDLIALRLAAREATLPLREFTDLVGTESQVLTGLFGSVNQGATQLALLARGVRDNVIPQFSGLGLTTENYLDFLGTFLEVQRTQGRRQFQNQNEVNQAIADYTIVLDRVTKLTGIQRDELNKQVRAQRQDAIFQNFLRGLEPARAAELQTFTAGLQSINPALGDAVKNILATGFPLGEFESTLVGTADGLLDNILALREGSMSVGDFATGLNNIAGNFQNNFGPEVLRAAGNVGEVGNALITVTNRFGDIEKVLQEQQARNQGLTSQITVTQEAFRTFKSQIEGLQTGFLQTAGPAFVSFLGGTDDTLKTIGNGITYLQTNFPKATGIAVGSVLAGSLIFDYAKQVAIVAQGTAIGMSPFGRSLIAPLRLLGSTMSFVGRGFALLGRAIPFLGAALGVGTSLYKLSSDDKTERQKGVLGLAGAGAGAVLGGSIGALFGGVGAIPGALIGAGLGSLLQTMDLPKRQYGGGLNASQLALVGERGPELALPRTATQIEPMIMKKSATGMEVSPMPEINLERLETMFTQQGQYYKSFADASAKMEKHLNTLVGISAKTEKNTDMGTRRLAKLSPNLV